MTHNSVPVLSMATVLLVPPVPTWGPGLRPGSIGRERASVLRATACVYAPLRLDNADRAPDGP